MALNIPHALDAAIAAESVAREKFAAEIERIEKDVGTSVVEMIKSGNKSVWFDPEIKGSTQVIDRVAGELRALGYDVRTNVYGIAEVNW